MGNAGLSAAVERAPTRSRRPSSTEHDAGESSDGTAGLLATVGGVLQIAGDAQRGGDDRTTGGFYTITTVLSYKKVYTFQNKECVPNFVRVVRKCDFRFLIFKNIAASETSTYTGHFNKSASNVQVHLFCLRQTVRVAFTISCRLERVNF